MINTIFYFVSTYDTYKQQWDNGEISSKTIVFIEDIKAIYKNNKRYGSMSDPDLYTKFEQFYNSTYDDSDLRDWLTRVEGLINDESNRLSGVIRDLDSDIQDKVTDMFDDATWVRNNVALNEYLHQDMNWDDQIHAYLQQVGYWTTNDQGDTVTQWSKIQQKVDSIDLEVSALSLTMDDDFTALQSNLTQQINTELQTAKTEIGNTYARGTDIDGVKEIIEWMYSGLKSSVSPSMSYAAILAAALNKDSGAISDLRTQVDYINGHYISTASLTTQVEAYKNQIANILSTAGVITTSSLDTAQADLFSRLSTVEGQISGTGGLGTRVSALEGAGFVAETNLASKIQADKERIILLAGLATKAQYDALGNTYLAKADLVTEIRDNASQIANAAGLQLTTNLDTAVASLVSNTSSTSAAISTIANNAASSVVIDADVIDARVNQMMVRGDGTFKGDVEANSFTTGGEGETGIVVISGTFTSVGKDPSKMYIAYDSTLHIPNIFIYDGTLDLNNNPIGWRCLSLANAMKDNVYFSTLWYEYIGDVDGYIKSSATSLSSSDFNPVTLYVGHDDNRYYTSDDALNNTYATGYYYANTFDSSVLNWSSITNPTQINTCYLQYLGTTGANNEYVVVAPIDVHYIWADYGALSPTSPVYGRWAPAYFGDNNNEPGIPHKVNNDANAGAVLYSNDAILSFSTDGNGKITNVTRGFSFLGTYSISEIETLTGNRRLLSGNNSVNFRTFVGKILMPNDSTYAVNCKTGQGDGLLLGTTFIDKCKNDYGYDYFKDPTVKDFNDAIFYKTVSNAGLCSMNAPMIQVSNNQALWEAQVIS